MKPINLVDLGYYVRNMRDKRQRRVKNDTQVPDLDHKRKTSIANIIVSKKEFTSIRKTNSLLLEALSSIQFVLHQSINLFKSDCKLKQSSTLGKKLRFSTMHKNLLGTKNHEMSFIKMLNSKEPKCESCRTLDRIFIYLE